VAATLTAIVPWLLSERPCQAADAQPFTQVAAVGAYDGNITGHSDVSIAPWNAVYTRGPDDWHGGLVAGGGVNLDLDDWLSALCVVDVAGQRYLDYPALSGFFGSASFQEVYDLLGQVGGFRLHVAQPHGSLSLVLSLHVLFRQEPR
jgi:hypothetical protein